MMRKNQIVPDAPPPSARELELLYNFLVDRYYVKLARPQQPALSALFPHFFLGNSSFLC